MITTRSVLLLHQDGTARLDPLKVKQDKLRQDAAASSVDVSAASTIGCAQLLARFLVARQSAAGGKPCASSLLSAGVLGAALAAQAEVLYGGTFAGPLRLNHATKVCCLFSCNR